MKTFVTFAKAVAGSEKEMFETSTEISSISLCLLCEVANKSGLNNYTREIYEIDLSISKDVNEEFAMQKLISSFNQYFLMCEKFPILKISEHMRLINLHDVKSHLEHTRHLPHRERFLMNSIVKMHLEQLSK